MLALLLGAVAGAPDAAAQQRDRDWDDCAQDQDRDRQLAGCSRVLDHGNRETMANRAIALSNRGNAHRARRELDAAFRDLEEAIRLDPRLAGAFIARGNAHRARGNLDAAIHDYDEAIRLDPRNAVRFHNRGQTHERTGNLVQAAADFREALRLGREQSRVDLTRVEAALAAEGRPPREGKPAPRP